MKKTLFASILLLLAVTCVRAQRLETRDERLDRVFGIAVRTLCGNVEDGIIKAGYPDLFRGNIFDGVDVTPYVEPGTQKRCFDGYLLFDGGLVVPKAFGQLTIGTKGGA